MKEQDGLKAPIHNDSPSFSGENFRAQEVTSSLLEDDVNDDQEEDDLFSMMQRSVREKKEP